jgi:hypothetical protein
MVVRETPVNGKASPTRAFGSLERLALLGILRRCSDSVSY